MGYRSWRLLVVFVLVAAGLVALPAAPVSAAGTVGDGSPESCDEDALEIALTDGGFVTFECGPAPITITVTSQKVIDDDTQIDGGGLVTLSGGDEVRILQVNSGTSLELSNITLSDGNSSTSGDGQLLGGAIFNNGGSVTIINSTLSGNTGYFGGAIWSQSGGEVTITSSTVVDNTAEAIVGALGSQFGGPQTITDSTISGNSGPVVGAIGVEGSSFSITNSTISGNTTLTSSDPPPGGIVRAYATTGTITNSTFSDNTVTGSGVIDNEIGTIDLVNTIIASTNGDNCSNIEGGSINSLGGNISDDASCPFDAAGDFPANTDPLLSPLANFGGPTETHVPLSGSPAIDNAIAANCPATDQRGYDRPVGDGCDIGSVEVTVESTLVEQVCVNRVTGTTRMSNGSCARSEVAFDVFQPEVGVTACVSRSTGELRITASGSCSRYDTVLNLPEDGPINVCISRVTGQLWLMSGTCGRMAQAGILAGE